MTLTEFLLARIAEDEGAVQDPRYIWSTDESATGAVGPIGDPARILAECGAKRQIVDWHAEGHYCTDLGSMESWYLPEQPCPTVQALALPYADHPDYREEWRP